MKQSVVSAILALTVVSGSGCGQKSLSVPFDLSSPVVVSEPENMMSHGSSFAIAPDGKAYVVYQGDGTQMVESGEILSIEMRMAVFPVRKWRNTDRIRRFLVMRAAEPVGGFEIRGGHCPSDPCLHVRGDTLFCLMESGEAPGPDSDNRYYVRYFDIKDGRFSPYVDRCNPWIMCR